MRVKNEEELGRALRNKEDTIEIEVELCGKRLSDFFATLETRTGPAEPVITGFTQSANAPRRKPIKIL